MSDFIADNMGLHFPSERWEDLQRGFEGATRDFGFDDTAACVDWLLSMPPDKSRLQVLASHLTIGETYFFRDPHAMAALAQKILPEAIRERLGREQRLRLWSAACCSGEEAYTLAILVHQALPDLRDWNVTIVATDINARFLQKAAAGTYGEWSFRNVPAGIRERYFRQTAKGCFAVVPEIRHMVRFAQLNLVDDHYPSLATDTNAMDVILCRNVLMYFMPEEIRRVGAKLHHALVDRGWLLVSPSEASAGYFPDFRPVNFAGAILFCKRDLPLAPESATQELPPPAPPVEDDRSSAPHEDHALAADSPRDFLAAADSLFQQGHYAAAAAELLAAFRRHSPSAAEYSLICRALANKGDLAAAQAWCDRWIAAEKMEPAAHYLRAVIAHERGELAEARQSLQRAIYLRADFVLAHFTLGNLARAQEKPREAARHFANAQRLLRALPADHALPESDGLTAGRLAHLVDSLLAPDCET